MDERGRTFDWEAYVTGLVAERGALSTVAADLAAERGHTESIASIERALRRLRARRHGDGGVWGARLLRAYGLPAPVVDRVRWMGQYHSRFTDLPTPVALELLQLWNRPPVSEGPGRAWIQLGLANVALRQRVLATAETHLEAAERSVASAGPAARVEWLLVRAFVASRSDQSRVGALLDEAGRQLELAPPGSIPESDRACLHARRVDQLAYRLNLPDDRELPPDPAAAERLYDTIDASGPPFARCRRHNGLGWCAVHLGRLEVARQHAEASVAAAGDGGHLRLRVMALKLLARVLSLQGDAEQSLAALARARAVAQALQDEELGGRLR